MTDTLMAALASISGVGEFHPAGSEPFLAAEKRLLPFLGARPDYVGLVRPGSAGELAAAVGFARMHKLAILRLYNQSNVGARLSGDGKALIIELGRMNRVLEVNADFAYARVEPGVSFADLAAYLAQNNVPLLVDSGRDPDASIAGSIFSKGFGYTPYGDHLLVQCGGEYVLPDGELLRTGMGAMADNRTWQLYKFALGPYSDGLAVQSDLMIPTQTGIWLMGQVPAFRAFALDIDDDDTLAEVLEAARDFKIGNTLPGTLSIAHRDFDALRSGTRPRKAAWRLYGALYGLPRVVEIGWDAVGAGLGRLRGVRLLGEEALAGDPLWQEQSALMAGKPGVAAPRFAVGGFPASAAMTFVSPIEGDAALKMLRSARVATPQGDLPFLTELAVLGRSLFQTVYLPYDPAQAKSVEGLASAGARLIEGMGGAGFGLASQSPEFNGLAIEQMKASPLNAIQRRLQKLI